MIAVSFPCAEGGRDQDHFVSRCGCVCTVFVYLHGSPFLGISCIFFVQNPGVVGCVCVAGLRLKYLRANTAIFFVSATHIFRERCIWLAVVAPFASFSR